MKLTHSVTHYLIPNSLSCCQQQLKERKVLQSCSHSYRRTISFPCKHVITDVEVINLPHFKTQHASVGSMKTFLWSLQDTNDRKSFLVSFQTFT